MAAVFVPPLHLKRSVALAAHTSTTIPSAKSRGERAWKLAVSDLTYLVLYFGAGMIIFPYVKDFYATQQLPSMGTIAGLQLLIRGPVFVLLCLALAGWWACRGSAARLPWEPCSHS